MEKEKNKNEYEIHTGATSLAKIPIAAGLSCCADTRKTTSLVELALACFP